MFLKMIKKRKIFNIYYISWSCAFNDSILTRIKEPRTGQFNREFGLNNMQEINFNKKNSPQCFCIVATDNFYTAVL